MSTEQPWYAKAFDASYLARYAHRSDEDAAREVQFLIQQLYLPVGARLLDYCCGAGRHSRAFSKAGFHVTGFDLSANLLAHARQAGKGPSYVRSDMRCPPFRNQAFDVVVSLFTSFGYFEKDDENAGVIREASRVLKPGGIFVLDFFNIEQLRGCLVSRSEKTVDGRKVVECRCYEEQTQRIEKEINFLEADGTETPAYSESVRAFTKDELTGMIGSAGLSVLNIYGDLQGSAFDPGASPRCVIIARKD